MCILCLSTAKDPKKIKRERISVHGFYRIGKVIGDGNFAVVRECKNRYVFLLIENVNRYNYRYVQYFFFNMLVQNMFSSYIMVKSVSKQLLTLPHHPLLQKNTVKLFVFLKNNIVFFKN